MIAIVRDSFVCVFFSSDCQTPPKKSILIIVVVEQGAV